MFDYSDRIEAFRDQKVRLSAAFEETLLKHRKANRDRLISRLPNEIEGVTIGEASFRPQGSFAMQTVIQTRFKDEEYDIDDGLVLWRHQLVDAEREELSPVTVREKVREALKDKRFSRQPKFCTNCVRVFYADADQEKHHVDFPIYRIWEDSSGNEQRELANESAWVASDPTAVNRWMAGEVAKRNDTVDGRGTQFRQLVQLMKRFCRSRPESEWDLPNGMKLTMLVAECQGNYSARIDIAFRDLLNQLRNRLRYNKIIRNLADPNKPAITRSNADKNVVDLETRIGEALTELEKLEQPDAQDVDSARRVWNWIFKSDGFFAVYDEEEAQKQSAAVLVEQKSPSMFTVPWREIPLWVMRLSYEVWVIGRHANSEHSFSWEPFESDGTPLPKHLYLRFQATTNAPTPYQVYWQVVNTGREAVQTTNGKRGQIVGSDTVGAGGLYSTTVPSMARKERTLYTGSHWIECFIVHNNICIARSGPFVVNIK